MTTTTRIFTGWGKYLRWKILSTLEVD